jgi:hypothetical protein
METIKTKKHIIYKTLKLDECDLGEAVKYWLINEKKINGKFYNLFFDDNLATSGFRSKTYQCTVDVEEIKVKEK